MKIKGTGISPDDPSLPEAVRKRWKILDVRALEKAEAMHKTIGQERLQLFSARLDALAKSKEPTRLRLRTLNAIADEMMAFTAGFVACKRGCTHCCYTGVPIAPAEADLIATDVRVKRRMPKLRDPIGAQQYAETFSYGYTRPCPFLVDGACSIYEHRPLTCRIHYNVDDDDMLCKLDHPGPVPVPYLDVTLFRSVYLVIVGIKMADIREFFPREASP